MKKKVLIMAGYYIPGVKGGGPIQSIKNLVENLSDRLEFYIVTSNKDFGDDKPYPNIKTDVWVQVGEAKVLYTDVSKLTYNKTTEILNDIDYDVMYLNSFFSYKFSIVPILLKKFKKIPRKSIVIAPRGEFSPGAIGLKNKKKIMYIKIARALGLYKKVKWHATTEEERIDIIRIIGNVKEINVANNLTANYNDINYDKDIKKKKGELKIVFISRVHPKKNLKKAIEFLKEVNGKIDFNIYGPMEDKDYWSECEKVIETLPKNIKVLYNGVIEHKDIINTFKKNHVFLFPTLGENYGHVISESLIGGCPVIISDRTPWRELEMNNTGWDIPLENDDMFIEKLKSCVNLDNEKYTKLSKSAFEYGKSKSNKRKDLLDNLKLFNK